MGPFEAYLAAVFFHLFGPSLFVLRLSLLLIFALFLVSIYLLTSQLWSKNLALVTLFLLSLGSYGILSVQLRAIGGYPETLLFGTLEFLIAILLALSFGRDHPAYKSWTRLVLYGCWGFLVGCSIWTDLLVLPFVLTTGLLLCVFCWREWRTWAPLCILVSFLLGILPFIIYNFTVPSQESSLSYFLRVYRSDAAGNYVNHISFLQKIVGTLLVGIPNATGSTPICLNHNLTPYNLFSHSNLACTLYQGGWSLCYLLLLVIAAFLNSKALWTQRHNRRSTIRYFARLMLLVNACVTMLLFANSPVSALDPWTNSRYLFCLLVATPAIIAPLWEQLSTLDLSSPWRAKFLAFINSSILIYIAVVWLMGYISIVQAIPSTQALNRQEASLITDLLHLHATHVYSEYWTCDTIIFQSNERIICAVVTNHIQPGFNRYQPYYTIVTRDPHSSFVFPLGSSPAFHFPRLIAFYHLHFRRYIFDGYVMYQPIQSAHFPLVASHFDLSSAHIV